MNDEEIPDAIYQMMRCCGVEVGTLIKVKAKDVNQLGLMAGRCYSVARHQAIDSGKDYVEGFLLLSSVPGCPIGHAWNRQDGAWVDYSNAGVDDTYVVVTVIDHGRFKDLMKEELFIHEFEKHTELPATRALRAMKS